MIFGDREEDAGFFPWNTPPSGMGSARCEWCDRDIYLPARPCSIEPPPGLLEMTTSPGQGDRCKWELRTRQAADRELRPA